MDNRKSSRIRSQRLLARLHGCLSYKCSWAVWRCGRSGRKFWRQGWG
uniref:Uncharacterized protein n=1 Tax=Vitis vinifera TaxID=29760 RepID=F6GTK8_VITVI